MGQYKLNQREPKCVKDSSGIKKAPKYGRSLNTYAHKNAEKGVNTAIRWLLNTADSLTADGSMESGGTP